MRKKRTHAALGAALTLSLALGCGPGGGGDPTAAQFRSLRPVDPEVREDGYVMRARPKGVVLSADERWLFVGQEGDTVTFLDEIRVLDTADGREVKRVKVGSGPQYLVLSPDGSKLYVSNRYANFLSVVDAQELREIARIPTAYYSEKLALSKDGGTIYIANRHLDGIEVLRLDAPNSERGKVTRQIPAFTNPRDVVVGPDGLVYVGNLGGTSVSLIDPEQGKEIDRLWTNSPINALVATADHVFVGTLGRGDGHPQKAGFHSHEDKSKPGQQIPDGNIAGVPQPVMFRGDTTHQIGFTDINNDLIVLSAQSRAAGKVQQLHRYTSDTVYATFADEPFHGEGLKARLRDVLKDPGWASAKDDFAPEDRIVIGAMPEQLAVHGARLFAVMSASDQLVSYNIGAGGKLTPIKDKVCDTGINPFGIALSKDGKIAYVADRLGDTISKIEVESCKRTAFPVGYTREPYPKTDYEKGEMIFYSSKFSAEALPSEVFPQGDKAGDKSCNHCHREAFTDGKLWTVGVGRGVLWLGGERLPPRAANIRDTSPLFWEGIQFPKDFDLEGNEFVLPTEWREYRKATHEENEHIDIEGETGEVDGDGRQIKGPDELFPLRSAWVQKQLGAQEYTFEKVTRVLIGAFLAGRQRLLPTPDAQDPTPELKAQIDRGRDLYFRKEQDGGANCVRCHPAGGVDKPFTVNENFNRVISESGLDNGRVAKNEIDGNFNVPSIRGVFDRPHIFLHDGRAKSLRAAILGPDAAGVMHPALRAGEDGCHYLAMDIGGFMRGWPAGLPQPVYNGKGCNEVLEWDKIPETRRASSRRENTHGFTRHLSAQEVEDLVAFVLSIE